VSDADFAAVVDRFGAALWRLTAGYANDDAARRDLYQDILLAIWQALPRCREPAALAAFVLRIGHNRGLTHRARTARRTLREGPLSEPPCDRQPPADELAGRGDARQRLHAAIRELPAGLAQAVMLHLEGLAQREIAHALGITENNVAVRLTRARTALRALLAKEPSR
jgi:RNA polymerase sigma-70 factor (ECF subfamily)